MYSSSDSSVLTINELDSIITQSVKSLDGADQATRHAHAQLMAFVETNFSLLVAHLLNDIVSSPRISSSRYEMLLVRSLVGILLRDLIGVRMLSEQAQISAIQELAGSYLKRWPAMMPDQSAPAPNVLVIVLREVAGLLQQLGNAPPPVQVCMDIICIIRCSYNPPRMLFKNPLSPSYPTRTIQSGLLHRGLCDVSAIRHPCVYQRRS